MLCSPHHVTEGDLCKKKSHAACQACQQIQRSEGQPSQIIFIVRMNALRSSAHLEYNSITTMNTYNQLWIQCEHGFTAWIRGVVNTSIQIQVAKLPTKRIVPKSLIAYWRASLPTISTQLGRRQTHGPPRIPSPECCSLMSLGRWSPWNPAPLISWTDNISMTLRQESGPHPLQSDQTEGVGLVYQMLKHGKWSQMGVLLVRFLEHTVRCDSTVLHDRRIPT